MPLDFRKRPTVNSKPIALQEEVAPPGIDGTDGIQASVPNVFTAPQTFAHSFYVMGPRPWIDLEQKYNLVVGTGISGTNRSNNTLALNQAFSDNASSVGGRRLLLPPGNIEIADTTVGLALTADDNVNLEVFGFGKENGSQIYQQTTGIGVMKFSTTSGNLRGLNVHDFTMRGAVTTPGYDLELLKVGYSDFYRLMFWTGGGVHVGTSSFQNVMRDCWWLNTDATSRALLVDSSSELTLTNPQIGEDGGSIWVSSAELRILGGQMRQWGDGVDADGPNAMGNSHIVVTGDSHVLVDGASMTFDQSQVLMAIDNGVGEIRNCRITINGEEFTTRYLIRQRTMTTPQSFMFQNNYVACHDASVPCELQVYDQFIGTEPHDSIISGNTFLSGTNWNMKCEDTFFKPSNNNSWVNNRVLETTGVT